ncbi:pentapeptide repeat-containing protein, partial [Micromonospora solifontis]
HADLSGADLTGASLHGVVWRATTCPDGTNSDTAGGTCAGHLS